MLHLQHCRQQQIFTFLGRQSKMWPFNVARADEPRDVTGCSHDRGTVFVSTAVRLRCAVITQRMYVYRPRTRRMYLPYNYTVMSRSSSATENKKAPFALLSKKAPRENRVRSSTVKYSYTTQKLRCGPQPLTGRAGEMPVNVSLALLRADVGKTPLRAIL